MSTPVRIKDGHGGDYSAKVTSIGQLITAPYAYSDTSFRVLDLVNTAYNFYGPKSGERFVITGMRIKADRDVSTSVDATIIVYEADADDTTVVDKVLHEEALIRAESVTLLPVNILVNAGKFVNAKTTDDDIYITIFGYYIPNGS